jgi:hypothetical protein
MRKRGDAVRDFLTHRGLTSKQRVPLLAEVSRSAANRRSLETSLACCDAADESIRRCRTTFCRWIAAACTLTHSMSCTPRQSGLSAWPAPLTVKCLRSASRSCWNRPLQCCSSSGARPRTWSRVSTCWTQPAIFLTSLPAAAQRGTRCEPTSCALVISHRCDGCRGKRRPFPGPMPAGFQWRGRWLGIRRQPTKGEGQDVSGAVNPCRAGLCRTSLARPRTLSVGQLTRPAAQGPDGRRGGQQGNGRLGEQGCNGDRQPDGELTAVWHAWNIES